MKDKRNTDRRETDKDHVCSALERLDKSEPWFDRHWRHGAATVYFFTCIFDFIIMPSVIHNHHMDLKENIRDIARGDKQYTLQLLDRIEFERWQPLTLMNGGLFHLSFGAILTGAVLMRGQERKTGLLSK